MGRRILRSLRLILSGVGGHRCLLLSLLPWFAHHKSSSIPHTYFCCTPSRRSCPPAQREHTPSPSTNSFLLHVGNYSRPESLVTRCHKRLLLPCLICGHDIIHYVFASLAVLLRTLRQQLQGLSDMPSAMKTIRKKFNKHRAASAVYSRLTPALRVAIFYLSCTGMSLTDVASTIVKLDGSADWRL